MTMTKSDSRTTELDQLHRDWLDDDTGGAYPVELDDLPELDAGASGLDAYMARLDNLEPLPASEQAELARRYRDEDDRQAGQLLVMTNLRFVVSVARDYSDDWDNALEFVQEGNVGLAKALERYDPDRDVKFTSYARYWVRARILDYLINRKRTIRLDSSRAGRKLFYNLHEVRETLREAGVEPSPERIAEALEVDVQDVIRVGNQMDGGTLSLDKEVGDHSSNTYGDLMEAGVESPEQRAADREVHETFCEAIEEFGDQLEDQRRQSIWDRRILSTEPRLLRELGADWEVSEERIRQIESTLHTEFREFFCERVGGPIEMQRMIA